MKRRFTILTAALALLAFLAIPMGMRGQTTVASFSRNGTTDNITGGTFSFAASAQTGYYQDGSGTDRYLQIMNNSAYWTSIPTSISFAAKIGGGTGNKDLSNPVYVTLLDADGNEIAATKTVITSHITTNTGDDYSISLPATNNVYGVKVSHVKESGYNVRYYSFSLSYVGDGGTPQPTTYTVTFDAGDGTFVGSTDFPNASNTVAAGTYTLPSAEKSGYTFDGWTATGITTPVTGSYTVSGDVDFTAQYTQNSGSGVTATLTQSNLELTGSYTTNTSKTIDGITYVYTDLMKSSDNIQAKASTGTIKNTTAYPGDITRVAITHSGTARATTINGSADGTNWTQVATGSGSITADFTGTEYKYFQITRGSNAAYWEKIEITYSTSSSSQSQSDLAITNATTDLTFDLYNNATAQVINYTTSSTGAITITPAESSYFTYVHDATAKTITVTPTAVTPSAQTVTISQEADEDYYAGTASFTVSVANSDPNLPGTVNNPYTVAEAIAATPSSGNVYIQGIVSSFYNTSIVGDGTNYRYYISDDGTTTTQLLVYKGKGLNQATFQNADDLLVGDEVVICGTLTMYQNAPEINSGNYLYSWNRPSTPVQEYTLTVTASDNVEIFTFIETTTEAVEGSTIQQVYNGTEVGISVSATTGYVLTLMVDGEDVTSELDDTGYYTFTMPAHNVTVSATASVAPVVTTTTYTLATSIESGKQYIIVGWANGTPYAMGYNKGNNRHAVEISVTGDDNETASATIANTEANPHEFTITSLGNGYYSIMDATTSGGYLYAAGSSNNYLKTEDALDEDKNGDWKITISDGSFSVAADQSSNRNVMQFNNSSTLFACYSSASQHPVFLYVKDETPAGNTITVDGYDNTDGGYVLLAWPESTSPADIDGMISDNWGTNVTPETSTYDLYSYDGSQEMEWRNYRKSNFNLVPGKGYLYASKAGVTLTYEGDANPVFAEVNLPFTENNFVKSLYLAGNSKTTTETFYVYDEELNQITFNYLVMNADGSGFTSGQATSFVAQPLQGFFVQAPGASTTLSTTDLSKAGGVSLLNVQVMRNRGTVVDNAIVSFSNGPTMKKFQLFENSTKLYIPQDNEDYAIVRSEGQGELPVSFRAAENGTYTLSMNVENIDMNYLHLIDNMTGMDIDLLQTPSYTFEANTNDYANRFKLVFAANGTDEADEASFAFFSDGNLIVNNEGNATLQVIDVNGRILSSETISGSCSKAINATTGVYMLRLINGDNVKVQKVVVR